jgi:membrane dipeptidase
MADKPDMAAAATTKPVPCTNGAPIPYADAHADIFYEALVSGSDIFTGENTIHVTIEGMRAAGQRLQVCSLWTPAALSKREAEEFCGKILDTLDAACDHHPDAVVKVVDRAGLEAVVSGADPRIGLIPWIEGGSPLRGSLDVFRRYAARGVKGIGLTWNHANEIADGCGVPMPRRGLTAFGRELVREMEAARVLVDAAHLPEPAFWDVMDAATRPVVVSHTGMRALVPMTRNVSDSMARAVADSGGFVGIDFYPGHVVDGAGAPARRAGTLDDLAEHVVHAVNVCGEDHVALGSDFDGFKDGLEGMSGVRDVPAIAAALSRRGLSRRAIEKVYGENLMRRLVELW